MKGSSPRRRGLSRALMACHVIVATMLFALSPTYAQTLDTEPPKVGFDSVDEARKGDAQVFTVSATDNQSVATLVFLYRFGVEDTYERGEMSRIGETDLYSITIPSQDIPSAVDVIEYYIEAKDEAGNRTLQGVSFDPLKRSLVDRPASLANNKPAAQESTSLLGSLSTTQKIAVGVVGVLVVGALVSAADSGSDGDSGGQMVPVTIESDPLTRSR